MIVEIQEATFKPSAHHFEIRPNPLGLQPLKSNFDLFAADFNRDFVN
jgi:hypothetical protein